MSKALSGGRKVFLSKIERLGDDRFFNGDARPQRTINIHIGRMPPDTAYLKMPAVPVSRLNNDFATAFKDMRQQPILVFLVLRLLSEGDIECISHALKNRGFAATLDAD